MTIRKKLDSWGEEYYVLLDSKGRVIDSALEKGELLSYVVKQDRPEIFALNEKDFQI